MSWTTQAILIAEAERNRAQAAASEAARQKKLAEKAASAARDAARAAVPPNQMFAPEHDELFGREEGNAAVGRLGETRPGARTAAPGPRRPQRFSTKAQL